ncbi:Glycosyltransferase GlyG [Candidatus Brocadiaceae bacterium]|nr:Glycosyltransferase GlyG [Candidatus Brocadiaceae bacterium]
MKVWNALEHVNLCLTTLLQNTTCEFELIIINNGSCKAAQEYLRGVALDDPRIRLIENEINMGPARANLQGVAVAAENMICLIDSDVLVPHGWLTRLVDIFEADKTIKILTPMKFSETNRHPVSAASSREVWLKTKCEYAKLTPLEQFRIFSHGLSIDEFDAAFCAANSTGLTRLKCPPVFSSSCCALLDADFIRQSGGVADAMFVRYGAEDVDLCWRVGTQGGIVAKTSSVYVHHFHNSSLISNGADSGALLHTANLLLYRKWKTEILRLVKNEVNQGKNLDTILSSYYIFQPLFDDTPFRDDLREAFPSLEVPEFVKWRYSQE